MQHKSLKVHYHCVMMLCYSLIHLSAATMLFASMTAVAAGIIVMRYIYHVRNDWVDGGSQRCCSQRRDHSISKSVLPPLLDAYAEQLFLSVLSDPLFLIIKIGRMKTVERLRLHLHLFPHHSTAAITQQQQRELFIMLASRELRAQR